MSKEVKELLFRLDIVPQSRDRRPRLSAKTLPIKASPSPLQRRGCCLTGCYLGIYRRTDEGVCPYFVVLLWHEENCDWKQREALFTSRKRPLHSKETPPLFQPTTYLHQKRRIPVGTDALEWKPFPASPKGRSISREEVWMVLFSQIGATT